MANRLSVRRVRIETIDEQGNVEGVTYGVMAADDEDRDYNDTFHSLEELNKEIQAEGCILEVIDSKKFFGVNFDKIGTENYYGSDCYDLCDDE